MIQPSVHRPPAIIHRTQTFQIHEDRAREADRLINASNRRSLNLDPVPRRYKGVTNDGDDSTAGSCAPSGQRMMTQTSLLQLPRSSSVHDLAFFLRTTGPGSHLAAAKRENESFRWEVTTSSKHGRKFWKAGAKWSRISDLGLIRKHTSLDEKENLQKESQKQVVPPGVEQKVSLTGKPYLALRLPEGGVEANDSDLAPRILEREGSESQPRKERDPVPTQIYAKEADKPNSPSPIRPEASNPPSPILECGFSVAKPHKGVIAASPAKTSFEGLRSYQRASHRTKAFTKLASPHEQIALRTSQLDREIEVERAVHRPQLTHVALLHDPSVTGTSPPMGSIDVPSDHSPGGSNTKKRRQYHSRTDKVFRRSRQIPESQVEKYPSAESSRTYEQAPNRNHKSSPMDHTPSLPMSPTPGPILPDPTLHVFPASEEVSNYQRKRENVSLNSAQDDPRSKYKRVPRTSSPPTAHVPHVRKPRPPPLNIDPASFSTTSPPPLRRPDRDSGESSLGLSPILLVAEEVPVSRPVVVRTITQDSGRKDEQTKTPVPAPRRNFGAGDASSNRDEGLTHRMRGESVGWRGRGDATSPMSARSIDARVEALEKSNAALSAALMSVLQRTESEAEAGSLRRPSTSSLWRMKMEEMGGDEGDRERDRDAPERHMRARRGAESR